MKARVRRLGQSRPTFVKHFIVTDTVEENLFELGRLQKMNMSPALSLVATQPLSRQEQEVLEAKEIARLG
eukprot:COSAG02_NODE_264_length_26618_cov_244.096459_9_plen_70_part_00